MPLKFRRRGMHSYPFCAFSSPHCLSGCISYNTYRGTNSIRMYTVDRKSGHLTLLSDTKSPKEHDGTSSSRQKAGFYTVLPNTVNLNTFFVYLLILLLHSQPALSTSTTSPRHLSSTSSRSLFFYLTTAATHFISALLLRSLHPQLTYLRLFEAPTPHTKGSSLYSPSCQLDYSAPTNRKQRDGRPLPQAVKPTLLN